MKSKMSEKPIFLIPRGRTGGSLMATMMGAHPEVSFGYEVFPDKLAIDAETSASPAELVAQLERARHSDEEEWMRALERNFFRVFCARVRRCGISLAELTSLLEIIEDPEQKLESNEQRLDVIFRILRFQMLKFEKKRWGSKMRVEPEILHEHFPEAKFLMMVRDGRDVLDSRLKVGNFQTSAEETARDWVDSIEGFEMFISNANVSGKLIRYEHLVEQPTDVLKELCEFCEIDFSPKMINYEASDLHLLRAPHGHLSATQISKGLNSNSIGRYRDGLSEDELQIFESIAGLVLKRFGYA